MIEVEPGEEVTLETRDAMDLQIGPRTTVKDLEKLKRTVAHPLTGPVYVKGAKPGDLLEIEYVDIVPERYGWTRFSPGFGFLPDLFNHYFVAHWDITPEYATSPSFLACAFRWRVHGNGGVAPSREQLRIWSEEKSIGRSRRQGDVPTTAAAVPGQGPVAEQGLRTIPPRENCGNADVKQLTRGSKLFVPVAVEGALYSVGDGHYAQGDGESCGTAIEMGATAVVRFRIHKDVARTKGIVWPRFSHPGFFEAGALERNFIATMGMPVTAEGRQEDADLTLAARNAVIRMIELLEERGWSREQAYVICSVAVDLRVSNVVDVPNVTVSALLPEAIFE